MYNVSNSITISSSGRCHVISGDPEYRTTDNQRQCEEWKPFISASQRRSRLDARGHLASADCVDRRDERRDGSDASPPSGRQTAAESTTTDSRDTDTLSRTTHRLDR